MKTLIALGLIALAVIVLAPVVLTMFYGQTPLKHVPKPEFGRRI